jgi:hypothetical protein
MLFCTCGGYRYISFNGGEDIFVHDPSISLGSKTNSPYPNQKYNQQFGLLYKFFTGINIIMAIQG